MTLAQIQQATRILNNIEGRLSPLLEDDSREGLRQACNIMLDVRRFAEDWAEAAALGERDIRRSRDLQACIDGLLQTLKPSDHPAK